MVDVVVSVLKNKTKQQKKKQIESVLSNSEATSRHYDASVLKIECSSSNLLEGRHECITKNDPSILVINDDNLIPDPDQQIINLKNRIEEWSLCHAFIVK